jgi:hypothetical protein
VSPVRQEKRGKSNLTQEDIHDDGDPSGRELNFPEEEVRKKVLKLVK